MVDDMSRGVAVDAAMVVEGAVRLLLEGSEPNKLGAWITEIGCGGQASKVEWGVTISQSNCYCMIQSSAMI